MARWHPRSVCGGLVARKSGRRRGPVGEYAARGPTAPKPHRRGFTLLEIIVTGAILGTLMVVTLRMMTAVSTQRRALTDRRAAVRAAENMMERLFAARYDEMGTMSRDGQAAAELGLPEASRVEIQVLPVTEPAAGSQVVVRVQWPDRQATGTLSTQLTAWRYAPAGGVSNNEETLSEARP